MGDVPEVQRQIFVGNSFSADDLAGKISRTQLVGQVRYNNMNGTELAESGNNTNFLTPYCSSQLDVIELTDNRIESRTELPNVVINGNEDLGLKAENTSLNTLLTSTGDHSEYDLPSDNSTIQFDEEVQNEANSMFEAVYSQNSQSVIRGFLDRLKNYKNSLSQKDHDILTCVIMNLFEEYRFFPEYPEKELYTTAEIFGGFLREKLLTYPSINRALSIIVDSLRYPPHTKLWNFGVTSLTAAHTVLRNMPKVCALLVSLEGYQYFSTFLKRAIELSFQIETAHVKQVPEVTSWENLGTVIPINSSENTVPSFCTANADTLVSASEVVGKEIKQPADAVVGKIAFLFNNLTQSCLLEKAVEMQKFISELGDEFCSWLAQYIVIKRVSVENNFQPLYKDFLITIGDERLDGYVLRETFRNIKILLQSERKQTTSNFSDRQLLKNLGLWLGKVTISRDRPIVVSDLDLKSLLLEANLKGEHELLLVVPFVTKIIGASKYSKIFHRGCAWIRSILGLLKELHDQEIKLNLKFEIEVLFKELQLQINSQITDDLLNDTNRMKNLVEQLGIKSVDKLKSANTVSVSKNTPRVDKNNCDSAENRTNNETVVKKLDALNMSSTDIPEALHWSPSYSYHEIDVTSLNALLPLIKISSIQSLIQVTPQLMRTIYSALCLAVADHVAFSIARSCKIAVEVAWSVCSKMFFQDFVFDIGDAQYSQALISMVYGLTSGMTYVTSRGLLHDRLRRYLSESLKNCLKTLNTYTSEVVTWSILTPKGEILDKMSLLLTDENIEVTTCFVVKTACEKAAQEIRKLVAKSEKDGIRRKLDANALSIIEQLPEKIRPSSSMLSSQLSVYSNFLNNLCGFQKLSVTDKMQKLKTSVSLESQPLKSTTELGQNDKKMNQFKTFLQLIVRDIDILLSGNGVQLLKICGVLSTVREGLLQILLKPDNFSLQYGFLHSLFYQMCVTYSAEVFLNKKRQDLSVQMELEWNKRLKVIFLNVCRAFHFHLGNEEFSRLILRILCDPSLQHRFNNDVIALLVQQGHLQMSLYDQYLALKINAEDVEVRHFLTIAYVQNLIKQGHRDLPLATECLFKLPSATDNCQVSSQSNIPVGMSNKLQIGSGLSTGVSLTMQSSGLSKDGGVKIISQSSDINGKINVTTSNAGLGMDRNPSLREKAEKVLREWIQLCYTAEVQKQPERALGVIVRIMSEMGVISSDAAITEFFHACAYVCSDVTYRLLKNDPNAEHATPARQRCYYTLDAFAKLAWLSLDDLLMHGLDFCPMPHQRLFMVMFNELTEPDSNLNSIAWHIFEAFGRALSNLSPRRIPGFAFAWLNIIGHRNFISRLLKSEVEPVKTTAMYTQLLLYHLKFLSPFLRNVEMPKSLLKLYKGTLRILCIIHHDFPELFCEYYCVFCDAIPTNCVYLRNLVLSAYPKNLHLPDLNSLDLKAQDLPELSREPKTQINIMNLIPTTLLRGIHEFLAERVADDFLTTLPGLLQNTSQATSLPGLRYNSTLMNALILHVGSLAIRSIVMKPHSCFQREIEDMPHIKIFESLSENLSNEGVFIIMELFRTLFERILVPKPHPWGVLLTVMELIKNPEYNLWNYDFMHCEPYFERLFAHTNTYFL
uniref:CCR4-Not complex component, Not1 n=1 Tax=Syphacia muris TaxID=451379 RepID=A0A0N5ADS8_9BILA